MTHLPRSMMNYHDRPWIPWSTINYHKLPQTTSFWPYVSLNGTMVFDHVSSWSTMVNCHEFCHGWLIWWQRGWWTQWSSFWGDIYYSCDTNAISSLQRYHLKDFSGIWKDIYPFCFHLSCSCCSSSMGITPHVSPFTSISGNNILPTMLKQNSSPATPNSEALWGVPNN